MENVKKQVSNGSETDCVDVDLWPNSLVTLSKRINGCGNLMTVEVTNVKQPVIDGDGNTHAKKTPSDG